MNVRVLKFVSLVAVLAVSALTPIALAAQAVPAAKGSPAGTDPSKWDIFLGYSALIPNGTVNSAAAPAYGYNAIDWGAIASITRYFNKNIGLQFEGDEHLLLPEQRAKTLMQPGDDFDGGEGGLAVRFPYGNVTPFLHVLVGAEQVGSYFQTDVFGFSLTAGGGLDVKTPAFNHHLSIRLFQGDYQYLHANFAASQGGTINFDPQGRISAGLVFGLGSIVPPPPVALACTASPVSIYPGDPVTVTATTAELDPKLNAIYSWSGAGVTGSGTTVSVATGSLAPGTYTVKGEVKEGKPGKEGLKPGQDATCSALFTVKAFEPPTVSCTASPASLSPGDSSTVTAIGVSPQNRPLTYSYSASAGAISGSGTTAAYNSAGAATGSVGITCNVADDKGGAASSGTTVTIVAPPPPPQPHAKSLGSISFEDSKRPTRVDNEAKANLDQVTEALKNDPTATVVLVGESTTDEKTPKKGKTAGDIAAERAVNTKAYLVSEGQTGIDPSRIIVRTGTGDSKSVEDYLVPAGAVFDNDVPGTTTVDESAVKPQVRKPLGAAAKKHKAQ
ncbi:MAG: OmpA family protein [Terracidiphilus sp.]|jgi:outer membrane protein OmpA-like peptidoglycan-associated protein